MHEGGSAFGRQRRGAAFGRAQHGGTGAGIDRHFIVLGLDAAKEYSTGWGISLSRRHAYAAAGLAAAAMHCLTMRSSSE